MFDVSKNSFCVLNFLIDLNYLICCILRYRLMLIKIFFLNYE